MNKAVFLDRDGTINNNNDIIDKPKELRILPGVLSAVKKINHLGFLAVIITNQAVIGKGSWKKKEVDRVHAMLVRKMKKHGAKIDAIYYCPHHPEAKLKRYRLECDCRRPNIGLLLRAMRRFHIDPRESFSVGDMTRDILAGKRAGTKTILVKTGFAGKDKKYRVEPDFIAKDLLAAVKIIEKNARKN
ncbi:MAG: HAD family hydrolase [Patescibacteria group bacterium]|nr:HAD family hydrolase [Patescibacteria group bacterium]MDE2015276.1 HAD family hydrolase [Patescibacteria group bacterium]MDE2227082.1 HAD family hydrolase [Patescibacteria group bacterium]